MENGDGDFWFCNGGEVEILIFDGDIIGDNFGFMINRRRNI